MICIHVCDILLIFYILFFITDISSGGELWWRDVYSSITIACSFSFDSGNKRVDGVYKQGEIKEGNKELKVHVRKW